MEKLQDLSQTELEELLDNTERVEAMTMESDEIQNIQLEREMALASNRSLAEQNLDMRPRLEQQRQTLVERYALLETARNTYLQHCQLRDGMVGQVSPEALFSRLQTEGANTEDESEALADNFLEGSLPLDSFLESFLSLRSLAHKRRVRIDKLQELLRQRAQDASDPSAMTTSTCTGQDPAIPPSPWNHQKTTTTTTNHHQQPPQSSKLPANHGPQPASSSALSYTPYPVSSPNPAPFAALPNPPSQFPPYPSPSSPFTPAAGYSGPRPAFGPPGPPACPYPTQSAFPAPHPGSAFGQYAPQGSTAPYPASYSYGGYSYPAAPANQSPTGRPAYRAGFGVPQPFS